MRGCAWKMRDAHTLKPGELVVYLCQEGRDGVIRNKGERFEQISPDFSDSQQVELRCGSLARAFVDSIQAPAKTFVAIDGGGHFAGFMKSSAFLEQLLLRVLPLAAR